MKTDEQIVNELKNLLTSEKFKNLYPHQNKELAFFDGIHADLKNHGYSSILFVDPNTKGAYYLTISKYNNYCSTRTPEAEEFDNYEDYKKVYDPKHKDLIMDLRDQLNQFWYSQIL